MSFVVYVEQSIKMEVVQMENNKELRFEDIMKLNTYFFNQLEDGTSFKEFYKDNPEECGFLFKIIWQDNILDFTKKDHTH